MAEKLSAAAAIAAALIALVALFFAWKQARNATAQTELQQRIREESAQPYVWADFRVDPRSGEMLQFVVKNEGPTVARDVKLHFEPPLKADWMLNPQEEHGPAKQGNRFSSIPPGREMVWHLASAFTFEGSTDVKKFTLTVSGTGPYGPMDDLTYILNIDDYRTGAATAPGTLLGIKKSLDKILKEFKDQSNRQPRR